MAQAILRQQGPKRNPMGARLSQAALAPFPLLRGRALMRFTVAAASLAPHGWCLLVCCALTACNRPDRMAPPAPPTSPVIDGSQAGAPAEGSVSSDVDRSGAKAGRSAADQYARCKARVEGSDTPGECTADTDCQRAGCSQELCIASTEAAMGVMSTCEVRPCFAVLEACGCHDGVCAWSVGD